MKTSRIFIVFLIFMFACSPAYVRKGKKSIKQEVSRLKEAQTYFRQLDTTRIRDIYTYYLSTLDSLKKYFKEKENDEQWHIMTKWGVVKKALKVYLESYPAVEKDFQFSYKQLADLQHDLRYKLISKEAFETYFSQEKEANNNLCIRARMLVDNANYSLSIYNQYKLKVDSLIQVMRAHQK